VHAFWDIADGRVISRPATRLLLENWLSNLSDPKMAVDKKSGYKVTDQLAFNLLLSKGMGPGEQFERCPVRLPSCRL